MNPAPGTERLPNAIACDGKLFEGSHIQFSSSGSFINQIPSEGEAQQEQSAGSGSNDSHSVPIHSICAQPSSLDLEYQAVQLSTEECSCPLFTIIGR